MLKKAIFLPVGSYEYHGVLLPPETDSLIASHVADNLCRLYEDSLLLPVLNYGISTEHGDFSSTVTSDSQNYLSFISTLLNSITIDDALIVIINGHGGNINILRAIESDYNYKNTTTKLLVPPIYNNKVVDYCHKLFGEFDTHAGSVEASLVAHYGYSKKDKLVLNDEDYIKKMSGSLRFFRTSEISEKGVIKDTSKLVVDSALGEDLHKFMVAQLKLEIDNTLENINRINNGIK